MTAGIAEIVGNAIERLEVALVAAYRLRDWGARAARLAELHEREARWWDVLRRNTPYHTVPWAYRLAVIKAQAQASDRAGRYRDHSARATNRQEVA